MERLIDKYARKLVASGQAEPGEPLLGFLDADIEWNRDDPAVTILEEIVRGLSINSIMLARPAEPYRTIVDYLAAGGEAIRPCDCETRTFLHDLPVGAELSASLITPILRRRRSVIVRDRGIVSIGAVSPEQTFITFCSVCFACFVKFFADYLSAAKRGELSDAYRAAMARVAGFLEQPATMPTDIVAGPFRSPEAVIRGLDQAGKKTVALRLVDSFFGNISYRLGDTVYISQTGSSLDELPGYIDACPLDNSSCVGVTASSEFAAHRQIVTSTGSAAVLHGHPRFSVIMSMDCDNAACDTRGECHRRCPEKRRVAGWPIVPGEVGTGRFGLCNTVPAALKDDPAVIVYGHGVFALGAIDFTDAFARLLTVENTCREEFFRRAGAMA